MSYRPLDPRPGRPLIVAHRGASGTAPENTLASLARALEQGAHILEIDVQLSADGQLVVIHDPTLERTTDAPTRYPEQAPWNVRDFTLAEIRELSAGEWGGTPQPVPTFGEVVDLVRHHDAGLLVETKTDHAGPELEAALAAEVKAREDWAGWVPARFMVGSFAFESLRRVRAALPGVNLAFILVFVVAKDGVVVGCGPATPGVMEPGLALVDIRDLLRAETVRYLGSALFGVNGETVNDFTAETVQFFRDGGVEVNFITDDPDTMRAYIERGVTSILTNHPDRLAALLPGL